MSWDRAVKELRAELQGLYGPRPSLEGPRLKGLILHGSHARGEGGSDSDIDLLVILDDKHSGVISTFGRHFVKQGVFPERLHEALTEAFAKRNLGDYDYEVAFPEGEATTTRATPKRFSRL